MVNALILAAGYGSRLRPLTDSTPKPLVRVGGESILERLIRQIYELRDVQNVYINTSYLSNLITEHVVSYPTIRRPQVLWESRPLGTAFTVVDLARRVSEPLLVIHGDLVLGDGSLREFVEIASDSKESMLAVHLRIPKNARSVIDHIDGVVTNVREGHSTNNQECGVEVIVNSGIYFFQRTHIQHNPEVFLDKSISPYLLNELVESKNLRCQMWKGYRVSVETVEDLEFARSNAARFLDT